MEHLKETLTKKGVPTTLIEKVLPALVKIGAEPDNLPGIEVSDLTAEGVGVKKLDAKAFVKALSQVSGGDNNQDLLQSLASLSEQVAVLQTQVDETGSNLGASVAGLQAHVDQTGAKIENGLTDVRKELEEVRVEVGFAAQAMGHMSEALQVLAEASEALPGTKEQLLGAAAGVAALIAWSLKFILPDTVSSAGAIGCLVVGAAAAAAGGASVQKAIAHKRRIRGEKHVKAQLKHYKDEVQISVAHIRRLAVERNQDEGNEEEGNEVKITVDKAVKEEKVQPKNSMLGKVSAACEKASLGLKGLENGLEKLTELKTDQ